MHIKMLNQNTYLCPLSIKRGAMYERCLTPLHKSIQCCMAFCCSDRISHRSQSCHTCKQQIRCCFLHLRVWKLCCSAVQILSHPSLLRAAILCAAVAVATMHQADVAPSCASAVVNLHCWIECRIPLAAARHSDFPLPKIGEIGDTATMKFTAFQHLPQICSFYWFHIVPQWHAILGISTQHRSFLQSFTIEVLSCSFPLKLIQSVSIPTLNLGLFTD